MFWSSFFPLELDILSRTSFLFRLLLKREQVFGTSSHQRQVPGPQLALVEQSEGIMDLIPLLSSWQR